MNYSEFRKFSAHLLLWKILNYPLHTAKAALIILDAPDKTPEYKFTDQKEKWWSNCMIVWEKMWTARLQ